MLASALHISALCGVLALLVIPESGGLALWSVVVTSVAGLIAQQMKAREDRQRDERRFRHDAADRMAAQNARNELLLNLAENTALTRDAGARADEAYSVANHVNEKIASLARAALIEDRAAALAATEAIRGDIARARQALEKERTQP